MLKSNLIKKINIGTNEGIKAVMIENGTNIGKEISKNCFKEISAMNTGRKALKERRSKRDKQTKNVCVVKKCTSKGRIQAWVWTKQHESVKVWKDEREQKTNNENKVGPKEKVWTNKL